MTFHDNPDLCCGAGICCDEDKRRAKLAQLLQAAVPHLHEREAAAVAAYIHDTFSILPKGLGFDEPFQNFALMARANPYE